MPQSLEPPLFRRHLIQGLWNHGHINLVQKRCVTVSVGRDIGTKKTEQALGTPDVHKERDELKWTDFRPGAIL